MNLVIALLAGLAIFPAVFSLGLEPAEGPGLLFVVLPAVFDQIIFGEVFLLGIFSIIFIRYINFSFFHARNDCCFDSERKSCEAN